MFDGRLLVFARPRRKADALKHEGLEMGRVVACKRQECRMPETCKSSWLRDWQLPRLAVFWRLKQKNLRLVSQLVKSKEALSVLGTFRQDACGATKGNLLSSSYWVAQGESLLCGFGVQVCASAPTYLVYMLAFLFNGVKSSFTRFREAFNCCLL